MKSIKTTGVILRVNFIFFLLIFSICNYDRIRKLITINYMNKITFFINFCYNVNDITYIHVITIQLLLRLLHDYYTIATLRNPIFRYAFSLNRVSFRKFIP